MDFRLDVGFSDHPKVIKLERALGSAAVISLLRLYAFCTQNRPEGRLTGLDADDTEIAARWSGDRGALVKALVDLRLLDEVDGQYSIHDWEEHNPWVTSTRERSERNREAALYRWRKPSPTRARERPEKRNASAPDAFEQAWAALPKRCGSNPKAGALRAWRASLRRGAAPAEMLAGAERYAKFITAKGEGDTEFVLQGKTFFGPDEHWRQEWAITNGGANGVAPPPAGKPLEQVRKEIGL